MLAVLLTTALPASARRATPEDDVARRLRATIRTGQEHAQIRATTTRDLAAARAQAARLSDQRIRQAAVLRERAPAQFVGQLSLPAAGATLHAFGSASGDGPASGVTYATAPGSFVVSPCAGRVAFVAPFRSYGKLLIVACGGGSDVVLARLGTLSAGCPRNPVNLNLRTTRAGASMSKSGYMAAR